MTQPDSPTVHPCALRSLSPAAVTLLRVYGEDAFSYLQSQVSADLRVAGERWVRYALWLDSHGAVQADSFILRESAESYLLFSYRTPAAALEKIVLSNVIADDVEVEHLGSRYRHWALWAANGEAASGELSALLPAQALPQAGHFALVDLQSDAAGTATGTGTGKDSGCAGSAACAGKDNQDSNDNKDAADSATLPALLFAGRNTAGKNFDLLLPLGAELPLFAAACREVTWAEREAQRIGDGVPAIPADIGAGDLPQEGGDLPRVAVSTSKGCYLGQEVIARWHATGQVRSGLFRVQFTGGISTAAPSAAPDVAAAQNQDASASADTAPLSEDAAGSRIAMALPLRLYAGTKPVGELRSFAAQTGAGLALLRLHRLGDARELSLEAGGKNTFSVQGAVAP